MILPHFSAMIGGWELLLIAVVLLGLFGFAIGVAVLFFFLTRRQNTRGNQPPAIQQQQR